MFKRGIFVGLVFLVLVFFVGTAFAQRVGCYSYEPAVSKSKSITTQIDEAFGGVVGAMAAVLFYEPFEVALTDGEGNPVFQKVAAVDGDGRSLSQRFLFVRDEAGQVVRAQQALCLDESGGVQRDVQGRPLLTQWDFAGGSFVHREPFVDLEAEYVLKHGELFQQTVVYEIESDVPQAAGLPLIVLILLFGGVFYTVWYGFINFTLFKHAIHCIRGKFDNPKDPGEISHFQALTSALSATVGLGNIAGVAVAIGAGGPGAVFWMLLMGLFGMTSKFHECALGQMYRWIDSRGVVHGGPKYYLSRGFHEIGWPKLGKFLAFVFALFIIGGSFGGGNIFQANQGFSAFKAAVPAAANWDWLFGVVLATLVGLVIIGGIRRIGVVTEKLVPFMCGIYVLAALFIIFTHVEKVPQVFALILSEAFSWQAGFGGFLGVVVMGIRRAVFSNEAGVGSASIAHSAAKTDEPIREGVVALLEPFIDTVVICTMTALVVIITGAYENPLAGAGVEMTRFAFGSVISWFPMVLSLCVVLFAFSTMISWSYYGEKGWTYLFGHGERSVLSYRIVFLFFVVLGSITSLKNAVDFSDLMILSAAFPNILGGIWLSKIVKKRLVEYRHKLNNGQFVVYE